MKHPANDFIRRRKINSSFINNGENVRENVSLRRQYVSTSSVRHRVYLYYGTGTPLHGDVTNVASSVIGKHPSQIRHRH